MIEIINNYGYHWTIWFGQILLRNTLFLGIVFILLHIFKNASAQFKYNIGLIGIIKLLIPPFIPLYLFINESSQLKGFPMNLIPMNTTFVSQKNVITDSSVYPAIDTNGMLFLIWTTIILLYLIYNLFSNFRLALILKDSIIIDQNESEKLGFANQIRILKSTRISMPMTYGLFPKKIFVPSTWDLWTDECKKMVIQHEYAHIKRYDNLTILFQILVQALYFFHPLVLLLNRKIKEFREMACDDLSVELSHESRLRYSRYLVEIAETALNNPINCEPVSALIKHKNGLLKRVKYQIKESNMFKMSKAKKRTILITLLLFIIPFSIYLMTKVSNANSWRIIQVKITNSADVKINDQLTSWENFRSNILKEIATDKENAVIGIEGEKDVPMKLISKVHLTLREEGIFRVGYVKPSGDDFHLMLPPKGSEAKLKEISEKNIINLLLTIDGKVKIKNNIFNISDVRVIIEKLLAENENLIISIQSESEAKFSNYISVLDQTMQAGANRIFINEKQN